MKKEVICLILGIFLISLIPLASSAGNGTAVDDEGRVYQCGTINQSGTYTMNQSIAATETCLTIQADDITLDFNSFNITGDNVGTDYGAYVSGYNLTTIKNGFIYNFSDGIYLLNNKNNNITNMNLSSAVLSGVHIESSSNNTLININASLNGAYGIGLSSSSNNTLININANSNSILGTGISLSSSSNNVLSNITANSNLDGIYLGDSSNNNTLIQITANSNLEVGIALVLSSDNNTLTDSVANSNSEGGVSIYSCSDNTLQNITTNLDGYYGIRLESGSNNNILTNITSTSNLIGIKIVSSSNNNISMSSLSQNVIPVYMDTYTNNFVSNQFSSNLNSSSTFSTASQEGTAGNRIDFNLTMRYINRSICPSCTYKLDLYPSESSLLNSSSNELIIGNFTPTRIGIYSLRFNITDSNNNSEIRKYVYLINSTSDLVNYYFREAYPTHGQSITYGSDKDAGSLLFDAPSSPEERFCSAYVVFAMDRLPPYLFGTYKQINYSMWYIIVATATNWTGVERYNTYSYYVDYQVRVSATSNSFETFNFSINLANDYFWSWYFMNIKLLGANPHVYSNQTAPSYANITYSYSTTPAIREISNEDIDLLSATALASNTRWANITLDGTGITNFSVEMPYDLDSSGGYQAYLNGSNCNSSYATCNLTSSSGRNLNFTLSLGSEHILEIYPNETTAPAITLISPADGESSTSTSWTFSFNVTDSSSVNCSLILDGSIVNFNSSVNNSGGTNTFTNSSSVATHTWSINCTDNFNNIGNSTTRNFTITSSTASTTDSSGGGSLISRLTDEQISEGVSKRFYINSEISFNINGQSHKIKLNSFNNSSATITISSDSQTVTLFIGDERKFELNNDDYYDLYVRLNSIKYNYANFTLKKINEKIIGEEIEGIGQNKTEEKQNETKEPTETLNIWISMFLVFLGILVIIIFVILFLLKRKRNLMFRSKVGLKSMKNKLLYYYI